MATEILEFDMPDGSVQKFEVPKGLSDAQVEAYVAQQIQAPQQQVQPQKPQERGWGDVAVNAIANAPASGAQMLKGVYETVTSPVETAQGLGRLAYGAARKVAPNAPFLAPEAIGVSPETAQRAEQEAGAVADFYKNRYGSMAGLKEALATDPFGVASDVSALATGGAGVTAKAPLVSNVLRKVGTVTNPLIVPEKMVGAGMNLAAETFGKTTGAGGGTLKAAFQSGQEWNPEFWKNFTNKKDFGAVIEDAKAGLARMKQDRNAKYLENKSQYANDATILKFDDIDNAVSDFNKSTQVKGAAGSVASKLDEAEVPKIQQINDIVAEWKSKPDLHTVEGLDALKQRIQAVYPDNPKQSQVQRAVTQISNAVRDTIKKQAPGYSDAMKGYSEMSDTIQELEKALSLGDKASVDTAVRKMQSLTRNNVTTAYGNRLKLASELEKYGANVVPAVAGQALSEWTPRGIQGSISPATIGSAGYYGGLEGAAAAAAASSPKLVGGLAYGAGLAASAPQQIASKLRGMLPSGVNQKLPVMTPERRRAVANFLYQAGANTQGNQQ
jgi:hypothetical protein